MKDLINSLRNKKIHIVGVTGAEGSSILRFLVKHNISDITSHDFNSLGNLEKSFYLWHKGIDSIKREGLYKQFLSDIKVGEANFGQYYLKDIDKADLIFVPQSWRLYKKENLPLLLLSGKIPFFALTRLYLDFAPPKIIAVTGTVGKGSTANIIYQLLAKYLPKDRKVYFAGNETWMVQLADKLDEMKESDILVLEISHRQLQDGFTQPPSTVVITNLYPNHLDEVSWREYKDLKLSLVKKQSPSDTAVLNYDMQDLRIKDALPSKVLYFSQNSSRLNTKNIQKLFSKITSIKSDQYLQNILASLTVIDNLGIDIEQILEVLPQLKPLTARMELLVSYGGIKIYNDIKSTTPWATLAALEKLGKDTILICGGRTKGIDFKEFAKKMVKVVKKVIIIKSQMEQQVAKYFSKESLIVVENLEDALKQAISLAKSTDNILISPSAGFFYSDFIKGKKSVRKLVTSLLPKEPVLGEI